MRIRLKLYGSVQGVGFRYFVREVAVSSQLTGWVRNMDDGSVEAVLDGKDDDVNYALEMCKRGPPSATVRRFVVTREDDSIPMKGFRIAF